MLRLATHAGAHIAARAFFVPAKIEHVKLISDRLRVLDLEEMWAQGLGPHTVLRRSLRGSLWARTYFIDGEAGAIMGLGGTAIGDLGAPWLLTTALVERIPVTFVKQAKLIVAEMLQQKPRLENHVLASYRGACRLLQILGFTLDEAKPYGPNSILFRRFSLTRETV